MTGPEHPKRVDIYATPTDPSGMLRAAREHLGHRAASAEGLDIHAALNTYETADAAGHVLAGPQLDVIGANHRRLIVRETEEGLWVGGCLIKDKADAGALVEFVTDWSDNTARWAV